MMETGKEMEISIRVKKCAFAKAASYYVSVHLDNGKAKKTETSAISAEPKFATKILVPSDLGPLREENILTFEAFVVLADDEPQALGKASIPITLNGLNALLPLQRNLTFIRHHGTDSEIPVGKMSLEITEDMAHQDKNKDLQKSPKRRLSRTKSTSVKPSNQYEIVFHVRHFSTTDRTPPHDCTFSVEAPEDYDHENENKYPKIQTTVVSPDKHNANNWNERICLTIPRSADKSDRKLRLSIKDSEPLDATLPLANLASHRAYTLQLDWSTTASALITITKHDPDSISSASVIAVQKIELRSDVALDEQIVALARLVDTAAVDCDSGTWLDQIDIDDAALFPLHVCDANAIAALPVDANGNFDLPKADRKPTLLATSKNGTHFNWDDETLIFPIPSNSRNSWCPTACTHYPSFAASAVLLIEFFIVEPTNKAHSHLATSMISLAEISQGENTMENAANKADGTRLGTCCATLTFDTVKKKRKSTRRVSKRDLPPPEESFAIASPPELSKRQDSIEQAPTEEAPHKEPRSMREAHRRAGGPSPVDDGETNLYNAAKEKPNASSQQQGMSSSSTICELARELSESKLEIGGLRACLENRDRTLGESEEKLTRMRAVVTELDQERRRLADDIKQREEQRVRNWQRVQCALQSNAQLATATDLKTQFRVLAEMYAHSRNQIDALQHVQSEEKRTRKHYDRIKEAFAKSRQEQENQTAYIQRLQKEVSKLEAYKTTVKMQEKVIKKLEHIVDTKLQEMCRQRIAEANAVEAQLSKYKNREHDQVETSNLRDELRQKEADHAFVIDAKDHRIRILEEQLIGKANEHGKEIADLKLKIFQLEMRNEQGQPAPILEDFDDAAPTNRPPWLNNISIGFNSQVTAARSPEGPVPDAESGFLP